MLKAILLAVEAIDSDRLPEFPKLVELLGNISMSAHSMFTGKHTNDVASRVEQEERDLFSETIHRAATEGVPEQAPLPYRRTLRAEEVGDLRRRIEEMWGATNGYWYPLGAKTHPSLIWCSLERIGEGQLQRDIKAFLARRGIRRIFELREFGEENFLLEAGAADLYYNGAEGHWISEANDWIVYCSHEDTMTLGGAITEIANDHSHTWERT